MKPEETLGDLNIKVNEILKVNVKNFSNGDSGGPLIKHRSFTNSPIPYHMLVGLVSFGPKNCGTKDQPGKN